MTATPPTPGPEPTPDSTSASVPAVTPQVGLQPLASFRGRRDSRLDAW
jgi:hypothetical protein